ncbi:50S ribosome-binding protein YggL, partial [Escherichia coli]
MAKNRSRRLRKKMHIDEFQELGFSVAWRFPEGTSEDVTSRFFLGYLTRNSGRGARSQKAQN